MRPPGTRQLGAVHEVRRRSRFISYFGPTQLEDGGRGGGRGRGKLSKQQDGRKEINQTTNKMKKE